MAVSAYCDRLDGTCGVGVVYSFEERKPFKLLWGARRGEMIEPNPDSFVENLRNEGGCGWMVAGFIDNTICKEAYDALKNKYNVVHQSPVRINNNSGHKFFFCIFDTSPRKRNYS